MELKISYHPCLHYWALITFSTENELIFKLNTFYICVLLNDVICKCFGFSIMYSKSSLDILARDNKRTCNYMKDLIATFRCQGSFTYHVIHSRHFLDPHPPLLCSHHIFPDPPPSLNEVQHRCGPGFGPILCIACIY